MFLNPQQAIKEGWISGVDPNNIQPNAIDVTADRMFQMNEGNVFEISKSYLISRGITRLICDDLLISLEEL